MLDSRHYSSDIELQLPIRFCGWRRLVLLTTSLAMAYATNWRSDLFGRFRCVWLGAYKLDPDMVREACETMTRRRIHTQNMSRATDSMYG